MAVKIRLARKGRKKLAYYHIVVADSRSPRDGRYIERIGFYNPITDPATIEIDFDKALDWLQKGAQPTETCRAILSYKGILLKKHLLEGVKKGAFDEAEAEKRFNEWMKNQEEKIESKKSRLERAADDSKMKRIEAEKKINETRAAELAKKNAEMAAKAAAAESAEIAAEETTDTVAEETTEAVAEETAEAVAEETAEAVAEETTEAAVEESTDTAGRETADVKVEEKTESPVEEADNTPAEDTTKGPVDEAPADTAADEETPSDVNEKEKSGEDV
jgi:small subunit ribosomal protein S16